MATKKKSGSAARIRVGIGGWNFEPWRGTFYPEGLAQKRELEFASRALTRASSSGEATRTTRSTRRPTQPIDRLDDAEPAFSDPVNPDWRGSRATRRRRPVCLAGTVFAAPVTGVAKCQTSLHLDPR